jgi:hypothetical protein
VAPPRKQADNRENKHFPAASGCSCLLEKGRLKGKRLKKMNIEHLFFALMGINPAAKF